MLKNTLKITLILIMGVTFSSCGSKEAATKEHAEKLCDCMDKVGLNKNLKLSDMNDRSKMRKMEQKAEEVLPKCALAILKDMEKDMSDMTKTDKKEYTKSFLKNVIDTECSDIILQQVPFDMMGMMIVEIEKEIDRAEKRRNY